MCSSDLLAPNETAMSLKGGGAVKEFVVLDKKEQPLALVDIQDGSVVALGTRRGVVKRVTLDIPKSDVFDVIKLDDNDEVVGAAMCTDNDVHLVFITSDAQLLHYSAGLVRPQGRGAGGMAGISLAKGAHVVTFVVAGPDWDVLTVASNTAALPGTDPGTFKITPLAQFPTKGRATGGVRCHTFRRTENILVFAGVASTPIRAAASAGAPLELPTDHAKRDATGTPLPSTIAALAGRMSS